MNSQAFSGHIILLCAPAWGHIESVTALACKVVQERPDVAVTFLTIGGYDERIKLVIMRHSQGDKERSIKNIRLVNIGGAESQSWDLMEVVSREFRGYYEKLANSEPIQCRTTGTTFDAIRKPDAAILDFFFIEELRTIHTISDRNVPVYCWSTASISATLRFLGPEKLGGVGDAEKRANIEAKATGRTVDDIMEEIYRPAKGNLVTVPGVPSMYDYELFTQESDNFLFGALLAGNKFVQECDGFVCSSSAVYEPEALDATRTWLAETNRPMFTIGPLLPPSLNITALKEKTPSSNESEVLSFLDKIVHSHGEKSLIYIAFGSLSWPKTEYLSAFVDALLELNIPFILSHASPKATLPPGFSAKVEESGIGFKSAWLPQQLILNHPAIGWFLTHCGQNSVIEAIGAGVPMIAWPVESDQPIIAARITLILDIAFELVEVRTGRLGMMPLHRGVKPAGTLKAVETEARNVLQNIRGPEGERKRKNVEAMRDRFRQEWGNGDALRNLREFLASVTSH